MEVEDGIYRIDSMLGSRVSSVYVVQGERSSLLFDVGVDGCPEEVIAPYCDSSNIDKGRIEWILLSHCDVDHFGGLQSARAAFERARVIAHTLDRGAITDFETYVRTRGQSFENTFGFLDAPEVITWAESVTKSGPIDACVVGSELIDLGGRDVEILHVPGHSEGHLAVRDSRTNTLIIGDAALGSAVLNADGTGAFPPTYRYVDSYVSSIQRLAEFKSPLLLTSHYPTYRGEEVPAFFESSLDFVADLSYRVHAALQGASKGLSLSELIESVNDGFGNWPRASADGAMAFPVAGHVEKLVTDGRAELQSFPGSTPKIVMTP
jgi:glyoxylase-like metal-dependent hydrolase (beta-lactamase superfamily II)